MSKTNRTFANFVAVLACAVFASALMLKVTPNDSWLAFVGWIIFFIAVQSPLFIFARSSQGSCTAWLSRRRS
jgi:hypothetical protein